MMGERGTTRKGATSRETSIEREKKEMKLKGRVRADDKKEKGKKKSRSGPDSSVGIGLFDASGFIS